MSFDLRHEAWIPVLLQDGTTAEFSLRDCFSNAKQIRRISAELPSQSFAILRLLLAIVHDAIGFHRQAEVSRAITGGIDAVVIEGYLDDLGDRFDLFHPERPFYQVAGLRSAKDGVSGLEKLISDVPNGSPFQTTRAGEALRRISAADAARWLVHCQAFDPSGIRTGAVGDPEVKGGKGYPIGPAWAGQLGGVVINGHSLAETLPLNLVPTEQNPADRPVWALDQAQTQLRDLDAIPAGPVAVLTWQSRRIRLVGDREGVTGVVLCNGDKLLPQNRQGVEAMTAWRFFKPQTSKLGRPTYMPQKHDPLRSMWQGLPAMIGEATEQVDGMAKSRPASTIALLGSHEDDALADLDQRVILEAIGMTYGGQEATVEELVHDSLDLRLPLLGAKASAVRAALDGCVRTADACVKDLGTMAANLARAGGDHDGAEAALNNAKAVAWAMLDDPVRRWLAELDADTDVLAMRRGFQSILRQVLERQARLLADRCGPAAVTGRSTGYGFMTAGKAEAIFRAGLRKELPLAFPQPGKKENVDE